MARVAEIRWMILALTSLLAGCGAEASGFEPSEEALGETEQAIMTDEPGNTMLGYRGVVELQFLSGARGSDSCAARDNASTCTGWMLSERVIVTAAHCFDGDHIGSGLKNIMVTYMRPGVGRDCSVLPVGATVSARPSPHWAGSPVFMPPFLISNPQSSIKNDIGVIVADDHWVGTSHRDYLRVYNDDLEAGDSISVYGMGNVFNTVSQRKPNVLRAVHRFLIDTWYDNSDLYMVSENGKTERICAGDSGAPVMHKALGLDLVAGGHSRSTRDDDDEFCGTAGTNTYHEKLTWDGPDDFEWIREHTGTHCEFFHPPGEKNNYARCFRLPLFNEAPDREQVYGSRGRAVGIGVSFL